MAWHSGLAAEKISKCNAASYFQLKSHYENIAKIVQVLVHAYLFQVQLGKSRLQYHQKIWMDADRNGVGFCFICFLYFVNASSTGKHEAT